MINLKDIENIYGLKTVKSDIVKNKKEAVLASKSFGYPVALKISSADIFHKSDVGGIALNLKNEFEVEKSYGEIMQRVRTDCPDAKIDGILVQEMISHEGFEIIIGYIADRLFGPTIMLGMGGIFADAFRDIVFRVLPITKKDVESMIEDLKFSEIILNGFRNIKKVPKELLIDVILKVYKFVKDNVNLIHSFDINPVIFYENDYRIVDFKYRPLVKNVSSFFYEKPNTKGIDVFFNAKSIAIVGVSKNPMQIGSIILESLLKSGYSGKIFPINPKYENIMNLKSYPSIINVEDKIDLLITAIPLASTLEILKNCKEKNIKNIIIISAGGKEIGNIEIESEIKKLAEIYDLRVIGCNCLGVFDGFSKIDTLFLPYSNMKRPKSGNISLLSQSGTVGIASLELLDDYGISKFISYGNRIDVDEGDLIEYLAEDDRTDVISIYIEGLEKGRKFYESAKKASRKKPVVVYKASRSKQSELAALSHTGFLSGTYKINQDIMRQAGIFQVDNLESLIASSKVLSVYKRIKGNRVLVITNGAGATIQALDRISIKNILKLSSFTDKTINNIKQNLPDHVIIGNPMDLTGTATIYNYDTVIDNAVKDSNVDFLMVFLVFQCKPITGEIVDILKKYKLRKPIICATLGSEHTHYMGKMFENEKIPIFYSVEEWVSAAEALILR